MDRRQFILASGAAMACMIANGARAQATQAPVHPARIYWEAWKKRFLKDGRVVDNVQMEASHSEGQGYGMILATAFDDQEAFAAMLDWSDLHLSVRGDGLYAWRWLEPNGGSVPDLNNASDGDLFIAWALARASRRFDNPTYLERATVIARALLAKCVVTDESDGSLLLLPAQAGFNTPQGNILNPSYYMLRAMREVAEATGEARFTAVARDGQRMLARLAAGGPVPDWVLVSEGTFSPAPGMSWNSGYEALRVPLYLAWSGDIENPAVNRFRTVLDQVPFGSDQTPVVIDRETSAPLEWSAEPGYRACNGLLTCVSDGQAGSAIPAFTADQSYYPATLHLLTLVAQWEISPQCVPV
ncbi:glycosyl hydrolase family 8 [Paroceanicella profunda]|nr:glycosyl hydrolase family 8 [Paroceanicella profunda]